MRVPAADFDSLNNEARRVVRCYLRRGCRVPEEDLMQEAWRTILEVLPNYDASRGADRNGYLWRALVRVLRVYLWRQSAPVSETVHHLTDLRSVTTVPVEDDMPATGSTPEAEVGDAQRRERIARRLREILDGLPDGTFAERVLLHEQKPAQVAQDADVPVRLVYYAVARARKRIVRDPELTELWKQQ